MVLCAVCYVLFALFYVYVYVCVFCGVLMWHVCMCVVGVGDNVQVCDMYTHSVSILIPVYFQHFNLCLYLGIIKIKYKDKQVNNQTTIRLNSIQCYSLKDKALQQI